MSAHYFIPFGSTNYEDLINSESFSPPLGTNKPSCCLFYDQEPILLTAIQDGPTEFTEKRAKLLANSEHSPIKKQWCKTHNYLDWYYFFHGFAALDWYRDYKYLGHIENKFTTVFISLNRLTTKDRSYRLFLVSKMMERDLVQYGKVSLYLEDPSQLHWKEEIKSLDSKLSTAAKFTVYKNLHKLKGSLSVDQIDPQGDLSAYAGSDELKLNQSALWHIVSETVFYYDKLHLTEKIFKPIVSHRPFILVGAPGNLAYLKSYGFKTFDHWIDESYDLEKDNDRRIDMIVEQLDKLCQLSMDELRLMQEEMQDVLDHNFNHFYGEFKNIIVAEMLENFKKCAAQWNTSILTDKTVDINQIDFDAVTKRLIG